jgi:CubicO group peptidase (beta-lactamase class C family)
LVGAFAGVVGGIIAWDTVLEHEATNPLSGLEVPVGRLELPTIQKTVDRLAADYLARSNVGLAIGVIRGDETAVWCYGGRSAGDPQPPDGGTLFELASVGKTFTALVLADMHLAGEVDLHDPLQQSLPAGALVPALGPRSITLLDLATQTSGLPSLPPDFPSSDPLNPYKNYTTDQLLADLRKIQLTRSPGAEYEYSNLGFGLLGMALSRRAGVPYEQLVVERICTPLGMTSTRMTLPAELRARLATPHDGGRPVPVWEDTTMPGAGSFLSTTDDMLRFLRLFLQPTGQTHERLARAAAETTIKRRPADYSSRSIGLAWHIDSENAHDIVWHNGAAGGSCSYVAFARAERCGVVVLSNSSNPVDELGHQILYLLLQTDP